VQRANGVVDLAVTDDAAAVEAPGAISRSSRSGTAPPSRRRPAGAAQRDPAERRRAYDVHAVIEGLFDVGTTLSCVPASPRHVTASPPRRSVGRVLANNPVHLGGAIDADAADKAARFLQLCDAFDLPVVPCATRRFHGWT